MSEATRILEQYRELNERRSLNEMATVLDKSYGLGIEIRVYSEDHKPAHMHIYNVDKRSLIARVLISLNKPKNIDSIKPYENEEISNTNKRVILKALLCTERDTELPIWKAVKFSWNMLHPNEKI